MGQVNDIGVLWCLRRRQDIADAVSFHADAMIAERLFGEQHNR